MPREARKNMKSLFLHIIVQGINKEYILNEECEMNKYLKILEEKSKKFDLKIIAYCIMNNHVHILVYAEKINNISELMRQVNTIYAMYYNRRNNRCGYVFRNRYKAEEIKDLNHLLSCINYIHSNPVKAGICNGKGDYKYSSYNDYKNKVRFINDGSVLKCLKNNGVEYENIINGIYEDDNFLEYEVKEENKKYETVINEYIKKNKIQIEGILSDKNHFKKVIKLLYKECNMTQKEIGIEFGMSRAKVQRILYS